MGDGRRLGSDGPVTLLFTDVEGSTDLRRRLGDELAQDALREHGALVRSAVAEHGGQEVKALGDGFMVAFTSPRRALSCAQAIQRSLAARGRTAGERAVRVRIGVHTGEVVEEDGDLFGQAVHAAARTAAKAKGGQILVSDVTRTIVGTSPELVFADRGRFRLKGFEERWRLFELAWGEAEGAVPTSLMPASTERTPFVGRSTEREILRASLERSLAGAGGMCLIGGEPGIGKTRLAEEVAAEATARDMAVFTGHSYEMAGASPYVAFVEILEGALVSASSPEAFCSGILGDAAPEVARLMPRLRRLFPDLPAPLDLPPEQERQYLFTCLSDVLTRLAIARPTLLVLDDLQWADESTLLFLEQMAAQLAHLPLLVVATYRDVEVGRPLARTFEDLHRRRLAQRIKLGALSLTETAQSVAALAGQEPPAALVAGLHDATEGNIFFLEEVFRDLVERGALFERSGTFRTDLDLARLDVPEGVRIVIDRRLDRLSDGARRLLALAGVAARVFSYRLLQALGDGDPDAVLDILDEAERAMLVRAGAKDGEFLFAHELIRQTLIAGFSAPRRARAHLRAAEATIALYAGQLDEHAAEIAHHLEQAGDEADPKQLFTYSLLAGQRALSTSAFAEALGHLERAASLQAVALPRERADLFFALGGAERRMGHVERALSAWESSISEYELLGDDEAAGRACAEVGLDLVWLGRWEEAIATFTRGLTALGDRVSHDRVRLLARLGAAVSYGNPVAGDGMFEEALRLTDELGDDHLRAFVFGEMAWGLNSSARSAEVVRTGLLAADGLRRAGDLWGLAHALGFVEIHLAWTGRLAEVAAIDDELVPLAERIGNLNALMAGGRGRAMRDFFISGDPDVLESGAQSDLELCERMGWPLIAHSYTWLGMAEFLRGDWDAAETWLRRGSDNAPGGMAGPCWGWWFQYLAYAGREQEALQILEERRSELPTAGQPNTWTAWSLLMAFTEGLFILERREEPAAWYPLIVEARATGALVVGDVEGWLLERVAGIAGTAATHYDAAEAHFLLALRQADEIPHQFERLETRRFYAQMLTERSGHGDLVRARQMLDEAVEGYARLGMPRHRDLANASLAAIAP